MNRITVVGSGIIGLTSALELQNAGFDVRIVAKNRHKNTLSNKVGAIWFPFAVSPVEKATVWATAAYYHYQREIRPGNGVAFIPFITAYSPTSDTSWTKQLPDGKVREARQDELPPGISAALVAEVPLAEPHLYLPHLFARFVANGGILEVEHVNSLQQLSALDELVINCTGLGSIELCNDTEMQPMRGQILRCKKMDLPSFADATRKGALSYVINRQEDCIVGGTDYENDWNESVEQSDTDLILKRLNSHSPNGNTPQILETLVGLRPKRSAIRFAFDPDYHNVFHNYGHGGAGFTVGWGCAIELARTISTRSQALL
ncbi:FAD-dependent oxidoreductase [Neolewinella aurantiaca]|uniref:D-amino-acid oxidase n=1 Tax=Neolewinella aurantiaca TaxID=2602767 RepID=A0A5C7FUB3_9BACT|nr:FAD-dependent oxidoreductase [Neolewinella aurantiaca]TXF91764.1 FAD-dependent oxidoreductase [Neolewinella aurantiaca]